MANPLEKAASPAVSVKPMIAAVVATAIVVGGGMYLWQRSTTSDLRSEMDRLSKDNLVAGSLSARQQAAQALVNIWGDQQPDQVAKSQVNQDLFAAALTSSIQLDGKVAGVATTTNDTTSTDASASSNSGESIPGDTQPFLNLTYNSLCSDGPAPMKDGEYHFAAKDGSKGDFYVKVVTDKIAFGDLNGDGRADDAAVPLWGVCDGPPIFSEIAFVTKWGDKYQNVATGFLGDHVILDSVAIQGRTVIVKYLAQQKGDVLDHPTDPKTSHFVLTDRGLFEY